MVAQKYSNNWSNFIIVTKGFCFFADKPNITSFNVTPDAVVNKGQKVTITCISKGVPSPNNTIIGNGTKSKRPQKSRSPAKFEKTSTEVSPEKTSTTYTIDFVTPGDAGIYTCIAENKVGNDSATLNLTVQGKIKKYALFAHSITRRKRT